MKPSKRASKVPPAGTDLRRLLGAAISHHQQGRLAKAEALYTTLLEKSPDQPDALNNLAALYQRQGRASEAAERYRRLLVPQPLKVEALNNYGVLLREQGDSGAAIEHLRQAVALRPDYPDAAYNLGVTYTEIGHPELAVEPLAAATAAAPARADYHANLARALDAVGRTAEALVHGEATLKLKDAEACDAYRRRGGAGLPTLAPKPFDATHPARNIIAFSLWGEERRYTQGAIANAGMSAAIYPGWTCRFYHDRTVPPEVLERLRALGAQVVLMPDRRGPQEGLFWRFFVAGDEGVDRFLCRDCDSRLNSQEANAVAAWLASNRPFHIMRDAVFHTELIMAGMWGGGGGAFKSIERLCRAFYRPDHGRWADQDFLRLEIWPRIKGRALIHDSYYRLDGAVDFPAAGRRAKPLHVGAGEPAD